MYETIKHRLTLRLPPLTYIVGGRQTGKTTLAAELAEIHGFEVSDMFWLTPSVSIARLDIWLNNQPYGAKKILIIDDTLTKLVQEKLLLWTEDQPPNFHIIILATELPEDTLLSRSEVFRLRPNIEHNPPVKAEIKGVVLALLRAFESGDEAALDELATRWTDSHTDLLITWCRENITKDFSTFTGEEVSLPATLPLRLLKSMVSDVRPRFLIRGPVAELLWSMK